MWGKCFLKTKEHLWGCNSPQKSLLCSSPSVLLTQYLPARLLLSSSVGLWELSNKGGVLTSSVFHRSLLLLGPAHE